MRQKRNTAMIREQEVSGKSRMIKGTIVGFGTDYLKIKSDHRVFTIMIHKVKSIDWCGKDRNKHRENDCGCNDHNHSCNHNDCGCKSFECHHDRNCGHRHCEERHCFCCPSSCDCEHDHHSDYHDCNHLPPGIPVCNHLVEMRLAGLNHKLNFQFFIFSGCEVCIELE